METFLEKCGKFYEGSIRDTLVNGPNLANMVECWSLKQFTQRKNLFHIWLDTIADTFFYIPNPFVNPIEDNMHMILKYM